MFRVVKLCSHAGSYQQLGGGHAAFIIMIEETTARILVCRTVERLGQQKGGDQQIRTRTRARRSPVLDNWNWMTSVRTNDKKRTNEVEKWKCLFCPLTEHSFIISGHECATYTVKMEAVSSFEPLIAIYKITWYHKPKDQYPNFSTPHYERRPDGMHDVSPDISDFNTLEIRT